MTGTGNENDPYVISTWEDLNTELRNIVNYTEESGYKNGTNYAQKAYIILVDDIEMPSDTLDDFECFSTALYIDFNGQNHTIKNISNIHMLYTLGYNGGIFSTINNSTIKNLKLKDVKFYGTIHQFGVLAGTADSCILENIYISGVMNVLDSSSWGWACGFCANAPGVRINKCISNCNIVSVDRGYGFFGYTGNSAQMTNCKSICTFDCTNYAGGFGGIQYMYNCESACLFKRASRITFLGGSNTSCMCSYAHCTIDESLSISDSSIYVYERNSTASANYRYIYYDKDIINDRAITKYNAVGASTSELKSSSWLINHGFLM